MLTPWPSAPHGGSLPLAASYTPAVSAEWRPPLPNVYILLPVRTTVNYETMNACPRRVWMRMSSNSMSLFYESLAERHAYCFVVYCGFGCADDVLAECYGLATATRLEKCNSKHFRLSSYKRDVVADFGKGGCETIYGVWVGFCFGTRVTCVCVWGESRCAQF